jgi:hypothetical protein
MKDIPTHEAAQSSIERCQQARLASEKENEKRCLIKELTTFCEPERC